MDTSLVSIIIPSFNRASLIGETIDSLLSQDYNNWECIVVDDGSTDNSLSILDDYARNDERIKVLQRDRLPNGAPTCRNIGLQHATGVFVIFLDSDDILAPYCLHQRVVLFQKNSHADFLVFNGLLFNETTSQPTFYWNVETGESDLARFLRLDALWQTSGPIYKRDFLLSVKGFDESLLFWQDYDLHLRSLLAGATYEKFLDKVPDFFIRSGRKDTISRSIGFIEQLPVLQQRITYYKKFFSAFAGSRYSNDAHALYSASSTLFYLCAQLVVKYSQWSLFRQQWFHFKKLASLSTTSTFNCLYFISLLKLAFRVPRLKKVALGFAKKHQDKMPNYYILQENKVTIIPYIAQKATVTP